MREAAVGCVAGVTGLAYWWEARQQGSSARSSFSIAARWSVVWLLIGLLPTALFGLLADADEASAYAAVYLIERALSIDNVFVFVVLIAAFELPRTEQSRLVSLASLFAFAVRAPAILVGVALFDAVHPIAYALGLLLLVLAWQTARAGSGHGHGSGRVVAALQRRLPVSEHVQRRWIVSRGDRRYATPALMCLIALVAADVAFAADSIPAGLAISHQLPVLLTANLFALLGLRPLYQLIVSARARLRYINQTIAVLLLLAALKLLSSDIVHVGPAASLIVVGTAFAIGAAVSLSARRA